MHYGENGNNLNVTQKNEIAMRWLIGSSIDLDILSNERIFCIQIY